MSASYLYRRVPLLKTAADCIQLHNRNYFCYKNKFLHSLVKSYYVTFTYIIIICNQAVTTLQVDSADCQRGHSFVTSGTYCP